MSRTLGWIATFGLSIGIVSLALAYAFGGRDLHQLFHRGLSVAQSCGDGAGKVGASSSERRLTWTGGDSIDIALPATVRMRSGEGSDIIVRGSSDTIAHVEVRGERITLNCRWSAAARDIEITLPGRAFRRVGLTGSGKVMMESLNQPELDLSISGSGRVRGQGTVDRLTVRVAGSGNARLADVSTKQLKVDISGSGNVEAAPRDDADINISGSGNVRLFSRPASLRNNIAGSGRVTQVALEAAEGRT
jgi:hypothetical protein